MLRGCRSIKGLANGEECEEDDRLSPRHGLAVYGDRRADQALVVGWPEKWIPTMFSIRRHALRHLPGDSLERGLGQLEERLATPELGSGGPLRDYVE
jgi:hypothetical protein